MEAEANLLETIENDESGRRSKISRENITNFILGTTAAASLKHLSHASEPYGHGAVAFQMAKFLLKSLETNYSESPKSFVWLNETTGKLDRFLPWTLLNVELYRQSGLLTQMNEVSYGLLLAAAVPTVLATTEIREKYYDAMVKVVNGANLLALGYLATKQQNYWGLGLTLLCALDSFCLGKLARCLRVSQPNARNVLKGIFAGLMPLVLKSV